MFENKIAVITGGTSGIGLALARALCTQGASVIMVGIDADKAAYQARTLADEGFTARGVCCDVSSQEAVADLANQVYSEFGRVDILINNAGVGQVGMLHELSVQDWEWIMDVNLKSVFLVSAEFIRRFLAHKHPALILNTGSETCFGLPGTALGSMFPYVASKHGLLGLTEMMARDYQQFDIDVRLLCPGPVATDIWNANRSRQSKYGKGEAGRPELGTILHDLGMDPNEVALLTLDAIRRGDRIIITHSNIRELIEQRYEKLSNAMDATDAWHHKDKLTKSDS